MGDAFLDPLNYLSETKYTIAAKAYDRVNDASLRLEDYEDYKGAAVDPYIFFREAYYQNQQKKIKE